MLGNNLYNIDNEIQLEREKPLYDELMQQRDMLLTRLAELAGNADAKTRAHALSLLARYCRREGVRVSEVQGLTERIEAALREGELSVVMAAVRVRNTGETHEAYLPALIRLVQSEDADGIKQALNALTDLGPRGEPAVPALVQRLESFLAAAESQPVNIESAQIVASTIGVLGAIGPAARDAVPVLQKFLADSGRFRIAAVGALRAITETEAEE